MKKIKKLLALIMAMTMVLGLGLTSFAADGTATITISGLAAEGSNTVKYIQILKPDVTASKGYSFADGIDQIGSYTSADAFLSVSVEEQREALEQAYGDIDKSSWQEMTVSDSTATATVGAGYYAAFATNDGSGKAEIIYTNPMILSVNYENATLQDDGVTYEYDAVTGENSSVVAKYETIPVTKDAKDEDKVVEIGSTVEYSIVTYVPSQATKYEIKDTLTGASYVQDSVKVKIGGVEQDVSGKISFTASENNHTKYMTINLSEFLEGNAGKKVEITYSVTVTGLVVGNTATVDDGKHEYVADTDNDLSTGAIQLTKYEEDGTTTLNGAFFVVYKKETVDTEEVTKYLVRVPGQPEEGSYVYRWTEDIDQATRWMTEGEGTILIEGLDMGDYWFKEVQAPEGYSVNTEDKKVTVDEDNLTSMEDGVYQKADPALTTMNDTKLASLPSTGGIGTTIFTIGGCAIMIAAAALYFVNRRKSEEN